MNPNSRTVRYVGGRPAAVLTAAVLVLAGAAGTLGTAAAVVPSTSPLAPPPSKPGVMHRYAVAHAADDWKKVTITQTEAERIARQFDLMVVAPGEFATYASQMHAANPLLKMLVYLNGTYLPKGQANQHVEEEFAHTASGARINQALTWGNFLMNVASPTWASSRAKLCKQLLASNGADGCYLDMMGPQALNPGYNTGRAVVPGTTKLWSWADYQIKVKGIADAVRAASPGAPIAGNGLADGARYYAPKSSKPLLSYLDAAHAEIWLREGRSPVDNWPSVSVWQKDVDMLADAGSTTGTPVLTQTKVWTSTATPELIKQWHRFALATFLLGTDGNSWFEFSGSRTLAGVTVDSPDDRVDVGDAAGRYRLDPGGSGAYVRSFTKGYAAVNPGTSTVTVTLPIGAYRNLDGDIVASETLAPHSGDVFTLAAG